MIYNLVSYLKTEFPAEVIYTNGQLKRSGQAFVPDRIVIVKESGGSDTPQYRFVRQTVQVYARDIEPTGAHALAFDIYNKIHGRFGLLLPAVTVDGVLYPLVETQQINGIQKPFNLGLDDNGRTEFTTNYQIIYVA